jgi:hypothetical protein
MHCKFILAGPACSDISQNGAQLVHKTYMYHFARAFKDHELAYASNSFPNIDSKILKAIFIIRKIIPIILYRGSIAIHWNSNSVIDNLALVFLAISRRLLRQTTSILYTIHNSTVYRSRRGLYELILAIICKNAARLQFHALNYEQLALFSCLQVDVVHDVVYSQNPCINYTDNIDELSNKYTSSPWFHQIKQAKSLNNKLLFSLSSHIRLKNIHIILEALSFLTKEYILVLGCYNKKSFHSKRLDRIIDALQLNSQIIRIPFVDHQSIPSLLEYSDLYLHASSTEADSIVLQQVLYSIGLDRLLLPAHECYSHLIGSLEGLVSYNPTTSGLASAVFDYFQRSESATDKIRARTDDLRQRITNFDLYTNFQLFLNLS